MHVRTQQNWSLKQVKYLEINDFNLDTISFLWGQNNIWFPSLIMWGSEKEPYQSNRGIRRASFRTTSQYHRNSLLLIEYFVTYRTSFGLSRSPNLVIRIQYSSQSVRRKYFNNFFRCSSIPSRPFRECKSWSSTAKQIKLIKNKRLQSIFTTSVNAFFLWTIHTLFSWWLSITLHLWPHFWPNSS